MKINKLIISSAVLLFIAVSCKQENTFDASGSFEAVETVISAEATGTLKMFQVEEGQSLDSGQLVGYVDTVQLFLKKKQLQSQMEALAAKKPNISVQLSALEEQLKTAGIEKKRIENLLKSDAATAKQLDDVNAQIALINRQIEAQKSTLEISTRGINKDILPLEVQVQQLDDQLLKSRIVNPLAGTVIAKYTEQNEMVAAGKPLYKIADLSEIILRVFISANQLPQVKLNQTVIVHTDDGKGGFAETEGVITWISDKAEFTPKTIQTKEERANLVYAMKVKVKNDGTFKIGMYGEIIF